ncbi:hypothetical protein P7C71_g4717, partial [Lecanoromycetidae sp. Uapishka_2]
MGINNTTTFASAAAKAGKAHAIWKDIPYEECRTALRKHFEWVHFHSSEFISWTSSLLYALQYAVRKTRNRRYPNAVSSETYINICLLDTHAAKMKAYAASDLIGVYKLSGDDFHDEYHTNEYTAHGQLDVRNCSSTVTLEKLRTDGLFELVPELDEKGEKHYLFLRVQYLRQTLFSNPSAITNAEGQTAMRVASLFRKQYALPAMIALLSLRLRRPEDAEFVRLVQEVGVPLRDCLTPYRDTELSVQSAPEVVNFGDLMKAANLLMSKVRSEASTELLRLGTTLSAFKHEFQKVANSLKDSAVKENMRLHLSPVEKALRTFTDKVADSEVDALTKALEEAEINPTRPSHIAKAEDAGGRTVAAGLMERGTPKDDAADKDEE